MATHDRLTMFAIMVYGAASDRNLGCNVGHETQNTFCFCAATIWTQDPPTGFPFCFSFELPILQKHSTLSIYHTSNCTGGVWNQQTFKFIICSWQDNNLQDDAQGSVSPIKVSNSRTVQSIRLAWSFFHVLFVFEKTKKITWRCKRSVFPLLAAFGHFVYSARLAVPYTISRDPAKKSPGLEDVQLNKLVFFLFIS